MREALIFGEPVNPVARLAEDETVLFLHDSLGVLLSWQQGLPFEELEVFENLASEAVINAIVYKVVSTVI